MDFLKILRSFEELIFEAATWLLFYPRTLWRIVRRPLATMDYSDREQSDTEERRYDDAISPPLTLLITVVLVNLLGLALHVPPPKTASPDLVKALYSSPQNLALFRSLVFSLIPLTATVTLLRREKRPIARETMRAPFYAQCYLAAPCAAFMGVGGIILQRPDISNLLGLLIMAGGGAWFMTVQTQWFSRRLAIGGLQAAGVAAWAVLLATLYLLVVAIPAALL